MDRLEHHSHFSDLAIRDYREHIAVEMNYTALVSGFRKHFGDRLQHPEILVSYDQTDTDQAFRAMAVRSGHSLAAKNAMAQASAIAALSDRISGYSAIRRIHEMVQNMDEEIGPFIDLLEELKGKAFCRERLTVSVISGSEPSLERLLGALPLGSAVPEDAEYVTESLSAVRDMGLEGAALCWDVTEAPEENLEAVYRL